MISWRRLRSESLGSIVHIYHLYIAEDWDHISKEAKDLIKKMLTLNPAKRFSAEQAYNDEWIQKNAPNNELNKRSMVNLQ